jgi:hypothetical protein
MVSAGMVMFEEVIIEKGIKGRGQFRIHKLRKGRHRPLDADLGRNAWEKECNRERQNWGQGYIQANRHKSR